MKIRETDLPGIGKKYVVLLKSGKELVIIIYNTGRREIYLMEDEEPSCVIELTDEEAKELGFWWRVPHTNLFPQKRWK